MLVVAEREQLPVQQARAGEADAWDVLFRRYQLPLYVYVFELVHDEQAGLDVVQEARPMTAELLLKEILEKVNRFSGGAAQHDDLTVIVVTVE